MAPPILHVVGARPNFMKAAPVIDAARALGLSQLLVHTGQHYDRSLSDVFFDELGLPEPDVNLGVGSGSHAEQTAAILIAFDRVLESTPIGLVVVYGDVNSTLAASLSASKRGVPIAHVEAGLRSFDDSMPEEINRRVTDLLASYHFVTAPEGLRNLADVGIAGAGVHFVGNPMIDSLVRNEHRFDVDRARREHDLPSRYAVATVHRPANVDEPAAARRIVEMLGHLAEQVPVVLPAHPRGRASLAAVGLRPTARLRVIDPLGYVDFLSLIRGAAVVVTDSGGLQEETTFLGIPCLTIRPNTERPVTVTMGTNVLTTPEAVPDLARTILAGWTRPDVMPPLWDGQAGRRIAAIIEAIQTASPPPIIERLVGDPA
jgi:UDP-N-acetylglucosamine 2-epimerase (non-hydrolysing)